MRIQHKKLIAFCFLSGLIIGILATHGLSFYEKSIAHIGILKFTGEVQIINIEVIGQSEINLTLYSDVTEKEFTINLYVDNELAIGFTTIWNNAGNAEFCIAGLDLSEVTTIEVEVIGGS